MNDLVRALVKVCRFYKRDLAQTLKQLGTHEPNKPIEALGNFFLGSAITSSATGFAYSRHGTAFIMAMEAAKLMSLSTPKPDDPIR
jgi:hypothetical protein